jgi:hypothetical protein
MEASSIPELTMAHFTSQYGAKKIVQEYTAAMIATLRQHAKGNVQLDLFQRFLSEVGATSSWLHSMLATSCTKCDLEFYTSQSRTLSRRHY